MPTADKAARRRWPNASAPEQAAVGDAEPWRDRARRRVAGWRIAGRLDPAALAPIVALLLAYVVPLSIVPPTLRSPLIDDWAYQLSVDRLVHRHELWVAPITVVTLVLQVGWGALFALPFGVTPVALRVSTLVAGFSGTLAGYGLFRELGATRSRAVVGALAVWLNPLTFTLSYTFMSDVPYLALLTAAAYLTVRSIRRERVDGLATASAVAGLAFLVRQQGVFVPLATVGWLIVVRPAWFRAARARTAAAALAPCMVAVAGYALWARASGLPSKQAEYLRIVRDVGWPEIADLTWRLMAVGLFFVGLFVFPLVVGALGELPAAWRRAGGGARVVAIGGAVELALWTNWFARTHGGGSFPFLPFGSVMTDHSLGVEDTYGLRPALVDHPTTAALAILFALAAAAALILVAAQRGSDATATERRPGFWRSEAGLVVMIGLGQFAGLIPPSITKRWFITIDRYYLPLLPFAVGLVLWAIRGRRFSPALALVPLLLLGAIDVLGVQDWLAFKQAQWATGEWLVNEQRIPARQVNVSAQWDGLRFYEYGLAHPAEHPPPQADDVWWIRDLPLPIDPVYIVAAWPTPRPGYRLYARRPYHSWLRSNGDSWVYVWQRNGARS